MQPLGFFDPLGYIEDAQKFERYRAVERKHGRIAMMAMAGGEFEPRSATILEGGGGIDTSNEEEELADVTI